jgi:hypothetical protein
MNGKAKVAQRKEEKIEEKKNDNWLCVQIIIVKSFIWLGFGSVVNFQI